MSKSDYIIRLHQVKELSEQARTELAPVVDRFAFRTNSYYNGLIDWSDPDDPLRRIVVPIAEELEPWGELDASSERDYTRVPGLEHKYGDTALLLVTDVCGAYCRFCFRKRLFMSHNDEAVTDVSAGLAYIRAHPEISDVLLTGGDPFVLSSKRLGSILSSLAAIDHVRIVRIGTKMAAFNPMRFDDDELMQLIEEWIQPTRRIYVMLHFNHPRELAAPAWRAIDRLHRTGATLVNQTPLLRGVNDDPRVLGQLLRDLSAHGVCPYYLFQCRPTAGNAGYSVPLEEAMQIVASARRGCSGLARAARFVMSHATGKIEILGTTTTHVFMRYHRAARAEDEGRLLVFERNATAHWLDDYAPAEPLVSALDVAGVQVL